MLDWERIEGFDWDTGNARKNADKHGGSQIEAEQIFFNDPLLVAVDAGQVTAPMNREVSRLGPY